MTPGAPHAEKMHVKFARTTCMLHGTVQQSGVTCTVVYPPAAAQHQDLRCTICISLTVSHCLRTSAQHHQLWHVQHEIHDIERSIRLVYSNPLLQAMPHAHKISKACSIDIDTLCKGRPRADIYVGTTSELDQYTHQLSHRDASELKILPLQIVWRCDATAKAEVAPKRTDHTGCNVTGTHHARAAACRQVNVPLPLLDQLASAAASSEPPLLIHISTDQVYSGGHQMNAETGPAEPVNAYGRQKLAAEEAIRQRWPKHVILRSSLIYGRRVAASGAEPPLFVQDTVRCPTRAF